MEKGFVVWNFDVLYELGNFVHIHGQGHGRRGGGDPRTVGCTAWKSKKFLLHFWVLLDLTRWEIGIKSGPERSNMPRIGFEVRYLRPYFLGFI